jgi:TP901 family phage tail tape measure protein
VSGPAGKAARSIRDLDRAAKNAKGGTNGLSRSVRGLEAAGGSALESMGLGAAAMRGGALAGGAVAVGYGLKRAVGSALSFERAMYDVEKATDSSGAQAQRYADDIIRMSKETGKTTDELAGMMAAAGFAGRPVQELTRFTEYAAKATSAWGTNAEETGQAMAVIGNIYGANQQRIEEIGDAINTAADTSATREKDLLDFIKRAGATGKQAGLTAEQVLAFGAAMGEAGTPMEVAATGFEALMNVMKLGREFSDKAGDGLNMLGVSSDKMRKQFVAKPLEATLGLLQKINKVTDPMKRAEILTNLFGKEYQDDIQKLMNSLPRLNSILGTMGDRTKYIGSVDKSFELWKEKDFARVEKAQRRLDALAIKWGGRGTGLLAGEADAFMGELEKLDRTLDTFIKKYQENGLAGVLSVPFEAALENMREYGRRLTEISKQEQERNAKALPAEQATAAAASQELYGDDRLARAYDMPLAINAAQERARRMAEDPVYKLQQDLERERQNRQAELNQRRRHREADLSIGASGSPWNVARERKHTPLIAKAEAALAAIEGALADLAGLKAQVDALNAQAARVGALGINQRGDGGTVAPTLGAGASFGFGPGGTQVDTSGLDAAKNKAAEAGQAIQGLNTTVAPQVNTASVDALNAKLDAAIGKLARLSGGVPQQMASREMGRQFDARRRGSFADYEHA